MFIIGKFLLGVRLSLSSQVEITAVSYCTRQVILSILRKRLRGDSLSASSASLKPIYLATPRHAMPCYAMLCHAMPCYAMLCHAMLCYAMPCHAMPCHATLCYAMPRNAMPCHAMPCHAMLCFFLMVPFLSQRCCESRSNAKSQIQTKAAPGQLGLYYYYFFLMKSRSHLRRVPEGVHCWEVHI